MIQINQIILTKINHFFSFFSVSPPDTWKESSQPYDISNTTAHSKYYKDDFIHKQLNLDEYDDLSDNEDDEFYTHHLDRPQMDVLPFDDKPFVPDPSTPTPEEEKEKERKRGRDRERQNGRDREEDRNERRKKNKGRKKKKKKDRNRNEDDDFEPTLGYPYPETAEVPQQRPTTGQPNRKYGKSINFMYFQVTKAIDCCV